MAEDIVRLEVAGHVALVTLDRPPVNALNRAMRDAIIEAFDAVSERDDIRVAVLTGAGKSLMLFTAGTITMTGAIATGSGGLTINGYFPVILTAENTYTGVTRIATGRAKFSVE